MLVIKSFLFNPLQENTYLLYHSTTHQAVLIDPGASNKAELNSISSFISKENLSLEAIWLTHSHIDHVMGLAFFADEQGVPYYQAAEDVANLQACPAYAPSFGIYNFVLPHANSHIIPPGSNLSLSTETVQVLDTPGHAQGHLSFYHPTIGCISGDALFAGSIGRTDLPGGNHKQLIASIKSKLLTLPDDTIVHPGHGPQTTIGQERRTNPFLA